MKNKLINTILIVICLTISLFIINPDIASLIKVREDNNYYQSIVKLEDNKEQEETDIKNNLSKLQSLNSETNIIKDNINDLTKVLEEKNSKLKEIENKIKNVDIKITNQKNEKSRIKTMFE